MQFAWLKRQPICEGNLIVHISLHTLGLECSFHMGLGSVLANVGMPSGRTRGGKNKHFWSQWRVLYDASFMVLVQSCKLFARLALDYL